MKTKWLIADVISVGPPARAECDILGTMLGLFQPVQLAIGVGEPLCDLRPPS